MKFKEFHDGQIIEAGPYHLTEESLLEFARDYDPQWFHVNKDAAQGGPYGGLIASGWQSCSIAMRLAADSALKGSDSFGSPGLTYLKWLQPVRAGDDLTLRITVLEARTSAKKPHIGVLRWRWQLLNQTGTEVLDMEATSLFDTTLNPPA
jgi:acyl dehydratase